MHRIRKSVIALMALLMIAGVPLTADTMSVTWEWLLDDPEVTVYRYQLDGEDPDGWTEIGGDESTLSLSGLDPEAEYTLYLQRSYDGVHWSASASSTAKAMLVPYAETAAEEPAIEVQEPEEVIPASEPAAEEPVERVYAYGGYTLEALIDSGSAVLLYPAAASDDDVIAFFAYENDKRGLGDLGVSYRIDRPGQATVMYPSGYSNEEAAAELDILVDDLIAYITMPVQPAEEAEPVLPAEEPAVPEGTVPAPAAAAEPAGSGFAVSLLLRGGVASAFSDSFRFSDTMIAEAGIGLDFSNILPVGSHFGFGLRTDFLVDFLPKSGAWDLPDAKEYFNVLNYAEMLSLDLKVTAQASAGAADIYIGGGAGFAIVNPDNAINLGILCDLGTFSIGSDVYGMDWFASAIAGVRFHIGRVFSIGAEVNYRYMVSSHTHLGSADVVLGFTF